MKNIKTLFILGIMIFSSAGIFIGCQKEYKKQSLNSTIGEINNISIKYQSAISRKYSKTKAQKLALADGVGAAVGASSGNPWGVLWGGFLTTLALEPHFREPKKKKPSIENPSDTNSNLFVNPEYGDGHNLLMYEAYINDIEVDISEGNVNSELVDLILSISPEVAIESPDESLSELFSEYESELISLVTLATNTCNPTDENSLHNFVNESDMAEESKELINEIINDLDTYDILSGEDFSEYLDEIEEVMNVSEYSEIVINEVNAFLVVSNSSNYFWKENFNE